MDSHLTRRDLFQGTLLLGATAFLAGCQPTRQSGVVSLPDGVWPDPKNVAAAGSKTTPVVAPINDLPQSVIARSVWTKAKPNVRVSKPMNGVDRITVHHSALRSTGLATKADVIQQLESIRRNHVSRTDTATGAHWVDIGYHYIIDPAGRIWEGRPVNIEGAHVSKTNDHNLGVMLLGNFEEHRPTAAALATLDAFVASQMRRYNVGVRQVYTHRELKPTECPGRYLQQYMNTTRLTSGRMVSAYRA